MKRVALGIIVYLLIAEALENAVLPQFKTALTPGFASLIDLRLLAMAGILAGLLLGETAGILTAICAAALAGFSQLSGALGASLVAFTIAASLAGRLSRLLRLQGPALRGMILYFLLIVEQLSWALTRKTFWPRASVDIPWLGLLITALLAVMLDTLLVGRVRPRLGRGLDDLPALGPHL